MNTKIRPYRDDDETEILRLNLEFEHLLSPMDSERFADFRRQGALVRVAERGGSVTGFLLGFNAGVDYDSINYQWFLRNLECFFYIDRVAVTSAHRSLGIARQFYDAAKAQARAHALDKIVAEINVEPPNEASLGFHRKLGFIELATQNVGDDKVVSLQCLQL